jgi:translocation and assembly module TamB
VALYPAYLDPYVTKSASARNLSNRRIPSQLVLGSEVGLDITDRLNFSVLSAPNRSDIPPEAGLRFQASDNLGLQGAVDQQGRWQGQLQLFFRF